jgi:hypothetical protein
MGLVVSAVFKFQIAAFESHVPMCPRFQIHEGDDGLFVFAYLNYGVAVASCACLTDRTATLDGNRSVVMASIGTNRH